MSIGEAASSLSAAPSLIVISGLRSATAVVSSEAAAATALSMGVDGGEDRGDPTGSTFEGAFLDPSLGDVKGATVGVDEVAAEAAAGSGGGKLSFTKKAS